MLNNESRFADVLVFTILLFILTGLLLLILLLIYTFQKSKRERINLNYSTYLIEILFKYLFTETIFNAEQKDSISKEFKKNLRDDRETILVIDTLRCVHEQTKGVIRMKTARIFEILDFNSFIRSCLHAPKLNYKLFALMVISEFKIEIDLDYILKLMDHRSEAIRSAAVACLAHFESHADLLFLTQSKMALSNWDINVLVQTVEEEHLNHVAYEALICCGIPDVMVLGIILSRLNMQIGLRGYIREKIDSPYPDVAEEATLTLISFSVFASDFSYLIEHYPTLTDKAKLAIVACMDSCSNKGLSIPFLEKIIYSEPLNLKIEALRCLLKIDLDHFAEFNRSKAPNIQKACLEVLDFNL
ncbi:MAG TPA: hypothetical protein VFP20_05565 [Bacteroidales bacterium]|nr:hypothetical protein [Bacteroidales bacterium]